jgi:hypothetical protein
MLKFVFNIEKLKSHQIHLAKGHNHREGYCASQIKNKDAWFSNDGRHTVVPWNAERLSEAHKLFKRKDAVQAISIVLQVGNQSDWREAATKDCPEGKPKKKRPADLRDLAKASREWAEKEFGKENVVSIEAHLDESSPHFHVIVTPIKDGKLQAKNWLDGPNDLANLRSRAHQVFNRVVACEYEPGGEGGKTHDPEKGAGKPKSPNQQEKPEKTTGLSGLIARFNGSVEEENKQLTTENKRLQDENHELKQKVQYSGVRRVKAAEFEAAEQRAEALQTSLANATKALQNENTRRLKAENEVAIAHRLLDVLTPEQRQWMQQEADTQTIARITAENKVKKITAIGDAMLDAALNKGMSVYAFEALDENPDLHTDLRAAYQKTDLACDIERVYADYEARNAARAIENEKTTNATTRTLETPQIESKRQNRDNDFDCSP